MIEKAELVGVKVFRFDPTVDKEQRYEVYRVPRNGYTVLNILQYIYEHYDRSLAFRSGCLGKGSGRCGVCPVLVNGSPALSCQISIEDGMTIEPHPKFELIKDLVVDFNRVKKDWRKGRATVEIIVDEEKCVGCDDCLFICPLGVYNMKRVNGKKKAQPADVGSCCGITCQICVNQCWKGAITIKPC